MKTFDHLIGRQTQGLLGASVVLTAGCAPEASASRPMNTWTAERSNQRPLSSPDRSSP